MNGCNTYHGFYNEKDGIMKGTITRFDTDWRGEFCISFLGTEEGPRSWLPNPSVTKLTTEVAYYEMLWKSAGYQ
jgi:hypothetical protein